MVKLLNEDLAREYQAIIAYRERIRQSEAMGEYGLSEVLRKIIAQEQAHLTVLADALGIDHSDIGDCETPLGL